MKKIYKFTGTLFVVFLMCGILVFSGCGRPGSAQGEQSDDGGRGVAQDGSSDTEESNDQEKKDYYVETEQLGSLTSSPKIIKTGKLIGASDVTVSAQVSGRVSRVNFEEGDYPKQGARVMTLEDSNKTFIYAVQRGKESVEAAELNYASTKVNLENAHIDLELAVKRAQQQMDVSLKDAGIQKRDAFMQRDDMLEQIKDSDKQVEDGQKQLEDAQKQLEDSEQQLKDAEALLLDSEKQLEDMEQQRADSEQQLKDAEQQLADSLQANKDTEQQLKDAEQQRLQAQQNSLSNDPNALGGSADLQLQKFDSDIQKAQFDLETKRESDLQTLEGFIASSESIKDSIEVLNGDIIDQLDKIVGVSTLNESFNDSYEQYLGAKDTSTLRRVEDTLRRMITSQRALQSLVLTVDQIDQLPTILKSFTSSLDQLDTLLDDMDRMLQQTVTGTGFPQSQLDGLISQVNGYQSQTLGQSSSITQQINQIEAFLRTYVQNQDSIQQQINILAEQRGILEKQLTDASTSTDFGVERALIGEERTDIASQRTRIASLRAAIGAQRTSIANKRTEIAGQRTIIGKVRTEIAGERTRIASERTRIGTERTLIGTQRTEIAARRTQIGVERSELGLEKADIASQNAIDQARLSLESAQNALRANQKTKEISLASLQNAIEQSRIGYNEAISNQSKLFVPAPIAGTIGEILVDTGEEVSPGTPLFTLTSTQDQEVIISLSSEEKDIVRKGTNVIVKIGGKEYTGTIDSVSDIADDNLLYKTTILLTQLTDRVGEVATVEIPMSSPHILLPINSINMLTSKQGSVRLWNGQLPEKVMVDLGKVRGSAIEIHSPLGKNAELVISPMNNYDKNIHDAKRKPGRQVLEKKEIPERSVLNLGEIE